MADLAIAALAQAVNLGFRDVESLQRDTDLAAVRDRDDFKKLAARVELEARAAKAVELGRTDGASPRRSWSATRRPWRSASGSPRPIPRTAGSAAMWPPAITRSG